MSKGKWTSRSQAPSEWHTDQVDRTFGNFGQGWIAEPPIDHAGGTEPKKRVSKEFRKEYEKRDTTPRQEVKILPRDIVREVEQMPKFQEPAPAAPAPAAPKSDPYADEIARLRAEIERYKNMKPETREIIKEVPVYLKPKTQRGFWGNLFHTAKKGIKRFARYMTTPVDWEAEADNRKLGAHAAMTNEGGQQ